MTTHVANIHALRRLLRPNDPENVQLIGHGVDAIVQHTQRAARPWWARWLGRPAVAPAPIQPTARQRIARYEYALFLRTTRDFATRFHRGELLKRVWKSAGCASAQPIPLGPRRGPHRGSPRRNPR